MRHPIIIAIILAITAMDSRTADSIRSTRPSVMKWAAPTPLDAQEEASPALLAIARRFNPAMALPIREVWPVEVRYAWADGASLVARTDGDPEDRVVVPHAELERRDWSGLPHRSADGRAIRYYIDAPGDDRRVGREGLSSWRKRFAALAGTGGDVSQSPYAPTQYVHAFWWNRDRGLLAIQYWFYYPFNEWVNHHEGDWEHIQVIVKGPRTLSEDAVYTPVGHQFFFHEFWSEPAEMIRLSGPTAGEDHALVYVGGEGSWFGLYPGVMSGGSYPLPGKYPSPGFRISWLSPDEDTSRPVRYLPPSAFKLVVLPEPHRLDGARTPELSWLKLPFYIGQRAVFHNPAVLVGTGGKPPLQPAARPEWLGPPTFAAWTGRIQAGIAPANAYPWPRTWTCARPLDRSTCLDL